MYSTLEIYCKMTRLSKWQPRLLYIFYFIYKIVYTLFIMSFIRPFPKISLTTACKDS